MSQEKVIYNKDGSLEFVNEDGETVAVGKRKMRKKNGAVITHRGEQPDAYFTWKTVKDGEHVLLPRDVNPKEVDSKYSLYANKRDLCLEIAMEIANGKTFYQLDKCKGFPSTRTVFYWYARDPEFRTLIDEARRVRAEFYHDQLVEVAETVDETNARSSKVKADVYKHLMSVNDRERFGQQTKVVGDVNQPVTFIFKSGIDRSPEPEPIPVEGKVVDDSGD
jgi:hypothetical protein